MKHVFQRGKGMTSAPAGHVLFRFGNPPKASSGSTFTCQWTERTPRLIHTHHDRSENVSLTSSQGSASVYSFSHPEFDSVHMVKRSWFEDHPVIWGERGVTMSFQGWSNGLWHDGVYAHWQNARLTDLILPGGAFQVEWGRAPLPLEGADEWLAERSFFAQKMSLIEAVRERFRGELAYETVLEAGQGSYEEVLTILLLRLAFPQQRFSISPRNEGQKRLAQNLNVTPLRGLLKNAVILDTNLDWGSSAAVQSLLAWQLRLSPFIPGKLWDDLKPGH